MKNIKATVLALLVSLALVGGAQAQAFDVITSTQSNVDAYYFHARVGEPVVQVYALGNIRSPGLYVVAEGTDLGRLFALAGGHPVQARERQDTSETMVRLFRDTGGSRVVVYEAELEEMLREPSAYPTLRDGDVLELDTIIRRGFTWRDAFAIVGGAASVALAVERIISLTR